jgi:hypothetical protein
MTANFAGQNMAAVAVSESFSEFKSVYADGMEYLYKFTLEEGITIKTADGEAELTIDNYGNGVAKVEEFGEEKEYQLEVKELSYEKVDVEVINEEGVKVEEYKEYDDLVKDEYIGQTVLVGFSVSVLGIVLTVLLAMGVIAYINGDLHVLVSEVVSAIQATAQLVNAYFSATFTSNKAYVLINPVSISASSAVNRIGLGLNVYTLLPANALSIVNATGLTPASLHTNKNHASCDSCTYYSHYHTANHGSGASQNHAHSWYGFPV